MKVTAVLKGMIDINGEQPIQIRIADGDKRTFRPTKIKVMPHHFEKGKVKSSHPKAREYNQTIEAMRVQFHAQAIDGLKKKKKRVEFYEYVERTIKDLERKKGTRRQYGSQIEKLKEFTPSFYLSDVDHDFLNRYKKFLKAKHNAPNTIWSAFKFLRGFIRRAYKRDNLIDSYPFDGYEFPKYQETTPIYLTKEEIAEIDKLIKGEGISEQLREAGTWFLIACNTGMRVSDIKAFNKKKNIVGGRLVIRAEKNKELVGLLILPRVHEYFKRVDYKTLSMHENTYNALLKIIAAAAGIDKKVSTHTARHTAAMMLTNAGVSQEVIAKILGHKDLRSTRVYSKITNQRIDLEITKALN